MPKRCTKCRAQKDEEAFILVRRSGRNPYRNSICRICVAAQRRVRLAADRDAANLKQRLWRKKNFEKVRRKEAMDRQVQRSSLPGYLNYAAEIKRRNAREAGIECSLTGEQLLAKYRYQKGRCALTGRELIWGPFGLRRDTLTIDRINRQLPYYQSNVRLVTYQANSARGPFDDGELLKLCEAILGTLKPESAFLAARSLGDYPPFLRANHPAKIKFLEDPHDTGTSAWFTVPDDCTAFGVGKVQCKPFRMLVDAMRFNKQLAVEAMVIEVPREVAPQVAVGNGIFRVWPSKLPGVSLHGKRNPRWSYST